MLIRLNTLIFLKNFTYSISAIFTYLKSEYLFIESGTLITSPKSEESLIISGISLIQI